jgi:RNA polymerase sigma-70 factor (ECF subfamily)
MSPQLGALRNRDPAAWNALYDELRPAVYSLIFHLLRANQRLAEDLDQETWLAALDGISHFDPARGELRVWLLGIARKRVALHFRQAMARATESMAAGAQLEEAESSGGTILPDDMVEQLERAAVVRASLVMLDDRRREMLLGKYVEGLSVEELANRTGKTPKAVESLLSRAREQLRALLAWYFQPESEGKPS